jgi:hypothetical protein
MDSESLVVELCRKLMTRFFFEWFRQWTDRICDSLQVRRIYESVWTVQREHHEDERNCGSRVRFFF